MKKCALLFVSLVIGIVVLGAASSGLCSEPVKVKGFFIGMSIDEALANFERLGFEGLSIRESTYRKTDTYAVIQPGSGDPFKVETSLNTRSVARIYFSSGISDGLFNTSGISVDIFREHFMKAYDIAEMTPFRETPGTEPIKAWEAYDLENGCRVRIYINKEIEMIKTGRLSEFSFD